jgi:ABC-type glutathione transport system ATPase component
VSCRRGVQLRLHPGEVEVGGWRVEKLSQVVQQLSDASPVVGRPRIIAIDGRGGAGKSTLAQRLCALVPASEIVHTDDIAWHHAAFDWAGLMAENILRPLHRGEAVEFRPPAWDEHDRLGTLRISSDLDLVWVEGTGMIRQELAQWIDASISTIIIDGASLLTYDPVTEIIVASPALLV